MQLADPADDHAIAQHLGRAARMAEALGCRLETQHRARRRREAFQVALEIVEIDRARSLAPLLGMRVAIDGRGDAQTAVTQDPDYGKGFFGSSLTKYAPA